MNKDIQEIAEYYGEASQMGVLQEECSELIKTVSKYLRYGTDDKKSDIAEEIADVEIMTEQIKYLLNLHGCVQAQKEYKLARTLDRIKRNTNYERDNRAIFKRY